jgi:hypothetical protein
MLETRPDPGTLLDFLVDTDCFPAGTASHLSGYPQSVANYHTTSP